MLHLASITLLVLSSCVAEPPEMVQADTRADFDSGDVDVLYDWARQGMTSTPSEATLRRRSELLAKLKDAPMSISTLDGGRNIRLHLPHATFWSLAGDRIRVDLLVNDRIERRSQTRNRNATYWPPRCLELRPDALIIDAAKLTSVEVRVSEVGEVDDFDTLITTLLWSKRWTREELLKDASPLDLIPVKPTDVDVEALQREVSSWRIDVVPIILALPEDRKRFRITSYSVWLRVPHEASAAAPSPVSPAKMDSAKVMSGVLNLTVDGLPSVPVPRKRVSARIEPWLGERGVFAQHDGRRCVGLYLGEVAVEHAPDRLEKWAATVSTDAASAALDPTATAVLAPVSFRIELPVTGLDANGTWPAWSIWDGRRPQDAP